jgi:uncharacterized protein YecE (DUF72 family)
MLNFAEMVRHSKTKAAAQQSLFETGRNGGAVGAEEATGAPSSDPPQILLGTSAFTASGWAGTFYPAGMKSADYLQYYASKFKAVEIDSTYYGTPAASTVENWYRKTPPGFVFAAKVPQIVTHTKMLQDCEAEFDEFIERMKLLREKLGPLLFQFPHFSRYEFSSSDAFFPRLKSFLHHAVKNAGIQFVVEIRNQAWLNSELTNLLKELKIALALTDHSAVLRIWEYGKKLDYITSDFAYVRWLGDRKGIERSTTTWDKTIVDRRADLLRWTEIFREFISRNLKVFAFANNHYAGSGPETIALFRQLLAGTGVK